MRVVIIDGSYEAGKLTSYLENLVSELEDDNHEVLLFNLNEMSLKYCTGCWSCWWGPGVGDCIGKDQASDIWAAAVNAEKLIIASPLIMGFITALTKKVVDKMVVLAHPYIKLSDGEMRHQQRYNTYPDLALILDKYIDGDDEDVEITKEIFRHSTANISMKFGYCGTIENSNVEVINEFISA